MGINNIGRVIRTNNVKIDKESGQVTKQFSRFALSMIWGFLERKPYLSAKVRYEREKKLISKFSNNPDLTTPTLLDSDDQELILVLQALDLTDLVQIFQNPTIHIDDKLQYLRAALEQLHSIHNTGETHGDPYLKNFFRVNNTENDNSRLYVCDFEYERTGPDPAVTDILILTANSINTLLKTNGSAPESVLSVVSEVYGDEIYFPFDIRDKIFFSLRFGVGKEFYEHFRNKKQIFS